MSRFLERQLSPHEEAVGRACFSRQVSPHEHAVRRAMSAPIEESPKDLGPLEWTGRFCGGLRLDIKRRAAVYRSDWTDAFKPENIQKTVSTVLFLFFACLSPAITFGDRFDEGTEQHFGVVEMVMSTAVSGLVFATLAGQPLSILGATGPFLAYTLVCFNMSQAVDVEFLPFYFWTCMWCALFTALVAALDVCALMRHVTKFSEDIFSGLISLIFIVEAIKPAVKAFTDGKLTLAAAFLELMLMGLTFSVATYLTSLRHSIWLTRAIRVALANFGVIIAIVGASAVAIIWSDVKIDMLEISGSFQPTMKLSDGERRPWIVNPLGMEQDFPMWAAGLSALPALGFAVLGFLDQNLTSLLVNRPGNGLKKSPAYHLDMLVRAACIPFCAFLGLPLSVASTVPSLTHVMSLTTYEVKMRDEGERKVPVAVVENRATNVGIHILIGLSLILAPLLQRVPKAVLFGVFLFMGVRSLSGNALFERLSLWAIWNPSNYPQYNYVRYMTTSKVHLYTFLQVLCLAILYGLKEVKQTAVVFPFFMASLAIIRKSFVFVFTPAELQLLDGVDGGEESPDDELPKLSAKLDGCAAAKCEMGAANVDTDVEQNSLDFEAVIPRPSFGRQTTVQTPEGSKTSI